MSGEQALKTIQYLKSLIEYGIETNTQKNTVDVLKHLQNVIERAEKYELPILKESEDERR